MKPGRDVIKRNKYLVWWFELFMLPSLPLNRRKDGWNNLQNINTFALFSIYAKCGQFPNFSSCLLELYPFVRFYAEKHQLHC